MFILTRKKAELALIQSRRYNFHFHPIDVFSILKIYSGNTIIRTEKKDLLY